MWYVSIFIHSICRLHRYISLHFFFNDTATTEIYTLSLHDALPIYPLFLPSRSHLTPYVEPHHGSLRPQLSSPSLRELQSLRRSEEHTSELQSQFHLVCRLLLEKKKITDNSNLSEV